MRLLPWWPSRKIEPDPQAEEQKRDLKTELAQAVVTFERKQHRVRVIATEALRHMKEGRR